MQIPGTTVLITGAASGVGRACAIDLANAGALVWGIDNDLPALNALENEIANIDRLNLTCCDVSKVEQLNDLMVKIAESSSYPVQILINNAAVLRDQTLVSRLGKRIKQHSIDDWNETISSNLTGTFLTARTVAAELLTCRKPGLIINTSSVVRTGNPGQSAYSATKAAVDALTVTWSQELAPYRIRVTAIAYGFAMTGMTEHIPPVFIEKIKSGSTVGRFARPEELVDGIRFIIGNDYFSGRVLELDGGLRF